jgi:hypothetical protein
LVLPQLPRRKKRRLSLQERRRAHLGDKKDSSQSGQMVTSIMQRKEVLLQGEQEEDKIKNINQKSKMEGASIVVRLAILLEIVIFQKDILKEI